MSEKGAEAVGFERVYTVTGYWDGPRCGMANFKGTPHYYESTFDEALDDYGPYSLRPVDDHLLSLELQLWDMYLRWYKLHYEAGSFPREGVPALPDEQEQYRNLLTELKGSLERITPITTTAEAVFRQAGAARLPSALSTFAVKWSIPSQGTERAG